ncbi:ABC transporter ATP-binding protein [Saccharothrix sp. NRRL B-16348]|uniref:phosphonate ABC transporter ATP-binding protein n=1 Tax=Saccharothrix sp. NRRL B-16348 TaxID=1415542 RepID=UPI0006AF3A6A|nr:ATP-binding cassette domain-containing protein [Saccharothrix sp. NRRL B-16348]KOX34848.1 ABC transporter ATP-binding protein [Saccharothrix sp. NRRL B-16348]
MAGDRVFELRRASVRLGGVDVLSDIDLEIEAGERVALIGPSGAGKTSLIRLLNGTVAATGGRVRALGCDYRVASTRKIRAARRRIGTVHQHFDLVAQLRAVHNVNAGRLGAWPFWKAALSLARPFEVASAEAALRRVGIGDKLRERTGDLSGGEQQRVAIARVLVQEPRVILADEPIASLDPARGREVVDLLFAISDETRTTLVASLHDLDIALGRFDRVVGLRSGRVVVDTSTADVRAADVAELFRTDRDGSS